MNFRREHIRFFFVLLPFILAFTGEAIQNLNKPLSSMLKLAAVVYMFIYIFFHKNHHWLWFFSSLLIIILGYFTAISPMEKGALESFIRYLYPIVALMYGYAIRDYARWLINAFIYFVIINDLWQIVNYINWVRGVDQWFYFHTPEGIPYYNVTLGIIRATGLVTFFALFGFINAVAWFLILYYYDGKYKKLFLGITLVSIMASLSYKTIGAFLVMLFLLSKKKVKILAFLLIGMIVGTMIFPEKTTQFIYNLRLRLHLYVIEGNSVRSESYRTMLKETRLLKGYGAGTFGGPSSIKYKSPLYNKFHFNWYGMQWLATTDTYYPHLFVELGLLAAFLYLFFIILPLFNRFPLSRQRAVYAIYFLLFTDAFFSFSLNHLPYLLASLSLIFPILSLERKKIEPLAHEERK